MKKLIYLIILLQYIIVSYLWWPGQPRFNRGQVYAGVQSGGKTEVKAEIAGKFSLRLFGYTSADSLVQVLGVRTFAQGTSDRSGYFLFKDISIASEAREICISVIDTERRSSFPLCIALPDTVPDKIGAGKPAEIGPLLLSPTLSLTSANIWQNQQAGLSGMTIPESEVTVSFFEVTDTAEARVGHGVQENAGPAARNPQDGARNLYPARHLGVPHLRHPHFPDFLASPVFISKVYAAEVPMLTTKADRKGRFSVNLPSSRSQTYRVFAVAYYRDPSTTLGMTGEEQSASGVGMTPGGQPTPKSQTLTFDIGAITDYFVQFVLPYLVLYLIIVVLLIILIYYAWTNKRIRAYLKRWYRRFIEKRLTPFAVRRYLLLKRLLYNFRQWLS